jgi:hypothetical protein
MEPSQPNSFACPNCATRLRVGPKLFEQKQIPCPECNTDLLVAQSEDGISASIKVPELTRKPNALATILGQLLDSPRRTRWIAGGVTSVLALVVLVALLFTGDESTDDETGLQVKNADSDGNKNTQAAKTQIDPNTVAKKDDSEITFQPKPIVEESVDDTEPSILINVEETGDTKQPGTTKTVLPIGLNDQGNEQTPNKIDIASPIPTVDKPDDNPIQQVANEDPNPDKDDTDVKPAKREKTEPVIIEKPKTLAERLAQPLASFKQTTPTTLSEIVDIIEELVQVDIVFDDSVAASFREQPVTLDLESTTPQKILQQAAARAKLQVVIGDQVIRLTPAE